MPGRFSSPLAETLAEALLERFERYVRIDTQAMRARERSPSTPGQRELAELLVCELLELGLSDAAVNEHGYVFATLPATVRAAPVIGLIAHLDTSPDAPGAGVTPLVHRDYDGAVIALPRDGTVLDPERMPELSAQQGNDLVTASGDTLLGADDKAGVAEIMTAVAHLMDNPTLPRPTLRVAFTPDEEIGHGATLFDVPRFGALCAYTMDGSALGELQDETFHAVEAILTIEGVDVHPGYAHGRMVNATRLAARIVAELPADLTPEATDGRDGFIHVYSVSANARRAVIEAIVRDFDETRLRDHLGVLRQTAEAVLASQPRASLDIAVTEQYPNMRRFIDRLPAASAAAEEAIRAEGLNPQRTVVRGGTDGSRLSEMGLPTPNIFTGAHEFHSVREWASLSDMASAAATIVRLAEVWTREPFRNAHSDEPPAQLATAKSGSPQA